MGTPESAEKDTAGEPKPKRKLEASDIFAGLFLLALVIGVPLFLYRTCTSTSPLREETRTFLKALRSGKIQQAYERVAPARRSELSYAQFTQAVEGTAWRKHRKVKIEATKMNDAGWGCTPGVSSSR